MSPHDGELQLACRRIAETRKQMEERGDLGGLLRLAHSLDAVRDSVRDSMAEVLRREYERHRSEEEEE